LSVAEEKRFFVMYADEELTESLYAYESIKELLSDVRRLLKTGYEFVAVKCFKGIAVKEFRDGEGWFCNVKTEEGTFHIQTNECITIKGIWDYPIYPCDCEYHKVP